MISQTNNKFKASMIIRFIKNSFPNIEVQKLEHFTEVYPYDNILEYCIISFTKNNNQYSDSKIDIFGNDWQRFISKYFDELK